MEILDNFKKTFNFDFKLLSNKMPLESLNDHNYLYKNNNNDFNNEDYLNKIKKLYQENKDRENELSLYQEAIKIMTNGENEHFPKWDFPH